MDFPERLESVPLIKGYIARIAGFQISRQTISVATRERVSHELVAEALSLTRGIDADQRQTPMRLVRMKARHLLEDTRGVLESLRRDIRGKTLNRFDH